MTARASLLAMLALLLASCASPIVGGECRDGKVACDGACVDLKNDRHDCGACGHDCGDRVCKRGTCVTDSSADGGFSRLDGGGGSVPTTSGGVGTPFLPDGGLTFPDPMVAKSCAIGQTACGDACPNLLEDHENCGACGHGCTIPELCSAGECKKACDGVMLPCAGGCTDILASPRHCGHCGVVCQSGICEDGRCADAIPGHVVVIGHDYFAGRTGTMIRLAGDGLFLARGAPVRTLVFRGSAATQSIEGIEAAFDSVALEGRQWMPIEADAEDVPQQLSSADAFVIYPQVDASNAELDELGRRWGRALTQFLLRGGVVLLFETATNANSGTYRILEPSGLFVAKRRDAIPVQILDAVGYGFGAATHATRQYKCTATSVHFAGVSSPGNILVEDKSGAPVVVQRIFTQ